MRRFFLSILYVMMTLSPVFAQKGENLSFEISDSKIYPGTVRKISVYVPSTYTGKQSACLAIMMDGIIYGLSDAIENLSLTNQMPVTIAVGIEPGKILDKDGNVIRYNRSNEFDRTDGVFASFLEKEVIPRVNSLVTSDNRKISISERPEDRMVLGASSGAIAAFAAAWNRPDLFSRVYSIVGTYVPMRGADQFPGIIRKSEPRKIRVYLQDNDKDTWNPLFGSWYEYNLLMNSALEFAGYEVSHHWDEGGHNGNNGASVMQEAFKFLWKGWPEAVGKGVSGNESLNSIILEDNDWVFERELLPNQRWIKSTSDKLFLVSDEDPFDHMCAVYPGAQHMAKAVEGRDWVMNYILGPDCELLDGEEFYYIGSDVNQIAFDTEGYLYCSTPSGIQVCDQNGRVRVILPFVYGQIDSIGFAGNTLYVISSGKLYSRVLKRSGFSDATKVAIPKSEGQG